jgi:hypothetical protein
MQTPVRLLAAACALAFALAALPGAQVLSVRAASDEPSAGAQQQNALERGYRTGYSDGYQSGWRDQLQRAARDYSGKTDYQRADRAYVSAYGALEDYRDGYQQGYETGYSAGYEQQGFNSTVPSGLARRGPRDSAGNGGVRSGNANDAGSGVPTDAGSSDSTDRRNGGGATATADLSGAIFIPQDTNLRVELQTRLSTDATQRGDRFDARVIEPAQFAGAVVTGRVSRVRRPGKVKGAAELQLDIEQVRLPDGRFANLNAQVVEVVRRTGTGVVDVDPEGGVRGGSSTKDDVAKVGAGAGIGAVIGAIAGGGKGAAIGAIIGAGVGTAGVVTSRGGDIRLEPGTELVLRTATDTRIQ